MHTTPEVIERVRLAREEFDARWDREAHARWLARKPKPRTAWQKAGEACQVLLGWAFFAFLGYLILRIVWLIL